MARRELVIHLAHGEPRLHIWCDRCLTSAIALGLLDPLTLGWRTA